MLDLDKIVVQALGYTDMHGMARAATLLKLAADDIWTKCAADAKKKYGKEINEAVKGLRSPWNSGIEVSCAAVKDVVAKVLISHDCYPYPELLDRLLGGNPFQIRSLIPDATGDQGKPTTPA